MASIPNHRCAADMQAGEMKGRAVRVLSDIPYGSLPDHLFDVYIPHTAQHRAPVICFIHGGAWRSDDKGAHTDVATRLAVQSRCVVAVPNYRLTPTKPTKDDYLHHPAHAEDVLSFLSFILVWKDPEPHSSVDDPSDMYLVGHSCAAHMLASIFLDSSATTPTLTPGAALLQSVKGIVFSEGIFDLDLLLSSFQRYRSWFIADVFGDRPSYNDFSTTRFALRTSAHHVRWLLIHSPRDTLVDLLQSDAMWKHLIRLHEEIGLPTHWHVLRCVDGLEFEHDEVIRQDKFIQLVIEFIAVDRP